MRQAVDNGPPLSKIMIGTGLEMTDLVSSGPGGSEEANKNYLKRRATSFLRIFSTLYPLDRLPFLLVFYILILHSI
jgi:hypothetical protein